MRRAQAQQDDLADSIHAIRTILSKSEHASAYFASELNWLNDRERRWRSDAFRIGMVGVTSSGKSTLVNALLGMELLPRAVRPSSNSLVVCGWGERLECTVHFLGSDRKSAVILGKAIKKRLTHYADEATNPGNIEGVAEIWLRSPDFAFGKGVALIDTPGLDAFGHDDHERLTLEVLLPTVDVVVFVTTCKANSDEKLREYVCLANDQGKPVVLVQNMIDSVCPKLGKAGEILKSREEVLVENRDRVEGLLAKAGVASVLISQVSAVWALQEGDARSGLPELIAGVQGKLGELAPAIADGRRLQLNQWLDDLVCKGLQSANPAELMQAQQAELIKLSDWKTELKSRYQLMKEQLRAEPAMRASEGSAFIHEAQTLSSKNIEQASTLQTNVEKWLRRSAASLSEYNKQFLAQTETDCASLNLRSDDIDSAARINRPVSNLGFTTSNRRRTVRSQQSGGFGKVKRFFDVFNQNWGYDEHVETWMEIDDFESFRKHIQEAVKNERSYAAAFTDAVARRTEEACKTFFKELNARARGLSDKLNTQQGLVQRDAISRELEPLLGKRNRSNHSAPRPKLSMTAPVADDALHEIDVESSTLALAQLAALIARHRFLEIRNYVLFDQAFKCIGESRRILIAGFDSESLADFVNRFWFDMVEAESGPMKAFAHCPIEDGWVEEIAVAAIGDAASANMQNSVGRYLRSPCVVFLMIDLQQIGASESALDRAGLPLDPSIHPVVVVVQSMRELENSGAIGEALLELESLVERRGFELAGVLVNDEQVWYSSLANELLVNSTRAGIVAEEARFMLTLVEEDRANAGKIIRAWCAQKVS